MTENSSKWMLSVGEGMGERKQPHQRPRSYESVVNLTPLFELPPFLSLCIYFLLQSKATCKETIRKISMKYLPDPGWMGFSIFKRNGKIHEESTK